MTDLETPKPSCEVGLSRGCTRDEVQCDCWEGISDYNGPCFFYDLTPPDKEDEAL